MERAVAPGGAHIGAALKTVQRRIVEFVRRYHRLRVDVEAAALDTPVLFVANHGFGGVVDLNVTAVSAALEDMDLDRPVTFLTHQLHCVWTNYCGSRPCLRVSRCPGA